MSGAVSTSLALKNNQAVEDGKQLKVPLSRIVISENPRHEPENLYTQGYKLIDKKDPTHSIVDMALSEDIEQARLLVKLIEEFENDSIDASKSADVQEDLSNVAEEAGSETTANVRSIVSLSRSLAIHQAQPIVVRKRGDGEDCDWSLIAGQRRLTATAYLHAKSRVQVHDKVEGAKIFPAVIMAVPVRLNNEEAHEFSIWENLERKGFTDVQWGMIFDRMLKENNPETGKPWNLKQIAEYFGLHYSFVRGRQAIMIPKQDDVLDQEGNVLKKGRGLTDEERQAVINGNKTFTWAMRKAFGEDHVAEIGEKAKHRARGVSLRDMQKLFDNTSERNTERRMAIAECMGLTLKRAVRESEARIAKTENREVRKRRKTPKGKGAAKATKSQKKTAKKKSRQKATA